MNIELKSPKHRFPTKVRGCTFLSIQDIASRVQGTFSRSPQVSNHPNIHGYPRFPQVFQWVNRSAQVLDHLHLVSSATPGRWEPRETVSHENFAGAPLTGPLTGRHQPAVAGSGMAQVVGYNSNQFYTILHTIFYNNFYFKEPRLGVALSRCCSSCLLPLPLSATNCSASSPCHWAFCTKRYRGARVSQFWYC